MSTNSSQANEVVSYLTLRRVVGLLGVGLPILLAVWGFRYLGEWTVQPSISDYYSLRTRDLLVGTLFAIAWFLFTYRGYERKDRIAGNLACLFALGVAFFPNSGGPLERVVHFSSAAFLFLTLAYFSLFLFTKTGGVPTEITERKRLRNRVYIFCGVTMLICIGLIGLYHWLWEDTSLARFKPVFWLESFTLWMFGWSWTVKGEALLKDK